MTAPTPHDDGEAKPPAQLNPDATRVDGERLDPEPHAAPATPDSKPRARPWVPSPPQIHRFKDTEAVVHAAAKRFVDSAQRAVEKWDRFFVVLAGGSTPRELYRVLAEPPYRDGVPWGKTLFAFSDERCVAPEDESSNYRMAHETLLGPMEIPEDRVLRMKGEQVPSEAAHRYEVRLGDLFLLRPQRRFDLVLLGIGADGHTASLFPETAALQERERWVVANHVPTLDAWRLTLTFPALNAGSRILFLATGEQKARVIAEAFGGVAHAPPHPCEGVAPRFGRREVLLDHAAASRMPEVPKDTTEPNEGPDPGRREGAEDISHPRHEL
jgi:6-phosphogluconolactonase